MRTSHIFLLCILGAALLSLATCKNENSPTNCCFKFYPRRLNKTLVRSYSTTDHRCSKNGVILMTQRSRPLCADPSLSWVENIMKSLDESSF